MKKSLLGSMLALALLISCGENLGDKPEAGSKSSTTRVRQSIQDAAPSKGASHFVFTIMTCNIRRGPGTQYPVVREARKGEKLECVARRGNWYKLKGTKKMPQQWVHKSVTTARVKSGS